MRHRQIRALTHRHATTQLPCVRSCEQRFRVDKRLLLRSVVAAKLRVRAASCSVVRADKQRPPSPPFEINSPCERTRIYAARRDARISFHPLQQPAFKLDALTLVAYLQKDIELWRIPDLVRRNQTTPPPPYEDQSSHTSATGKASLPWIRPAVL